MKDLPADYLERIDVMILRIERQQEETHQYAVEQHKLMAERGNLNAAADLGLAPWQATALIMSSIATFAASAITLAKTMGWLG